MSKILIKPPQIRASAQRIQENARSIKIATMEVDTIICKVYDTHFSGANANYFRDTYLKKRDVLGSFSEKLGMFSNRLFDIVNKFELSDQALNQGSVLGENTQISYRDHLDLSFSFGDLKKLVAGGYLATNLGWSALRPNSLIFTGPNWMREAVGIKKMTRVIRPSVLVKQMAILSYIEDAVSGIKTGFDTYTNSEYAGTDSAGPAAIIDGFTKVAIGAAGTTVLVGVTAGISAIGATVAAPAVVVGAAVIATWVVGGIALNKFVQSPAWLTWQESEYRSNIIDEATAIKNNAVEYIQSTVSSTIQSVEKAFSPFTKKLLQNSV